MSSQDSRRAGEKVEEIIEDEYDGLEIDRQRHHDARNGEKLVQIKGCLRRMSYDPSRRGRFRVWDQEIEHVDQYVFAIYEQDDETDEIEIITHRTMQPDEVRERIEEEEISWSSAGTTATAGERQAKISWAVIFPEIAEEEGELFDS